MPGWLLAAALALSSPTAPSDADDVVPSEVMRLPTELQQRLHSEILPTAQTPRQRLQAIMDLLTAPEGLALNYRDDATHSAAQAYATREVNCLTFTLLFLALARESGLNAQAQAVEQTLSWHQQDSTVFRANHVNARVRIGKSEVVVDIRGNSVSMRHPPAPISDQRLLAHYYNNLAMQRMARGELDTAQRHMATALSLAPEYAPHWSNAGVLRRRTGDEATAERDYLRALALDGDNALALMNLAALAQRRGDVQGEQAYREQLESIQRGDPFYQFLLGARLQAAGDLPAAVDQFRRAIRLHRGEHRFHAALADAYQQLGQTRLARESLRRALALSTGEAHQGYQGRFERLR
jgi:Flp pilus assembly protein TadD